MATVTRYVDTDVSGGAGDGTSWADAYSSLNAWESAEQTNLVSDGDSHIVYCRASSGTADTTNIVLDGWTTSVTNTITIEAADSDKASTSFNTSKYRLSSTAASGRTFEIKDDNVFINNIQFIHAGTTGSTDRSIEINLYRSNVNIDGCFIKGGYQGVYCNSNNDARIINITNCIVINTYQSGYDQLGGNSAGVKIYNNTAFNCNTSSTANRGGFRIADVNIGALKNNLSMSCNNDFSDWGDNIGDYNISSDTTAYGSNSLTSRTATASASPGVGDWVIFTNITGGSEDFSLQNNAENDAQGAGVGPSSDANVPTTDIDGNSRTGTTCDVGAYEYTSSGTDISCSTGAVSVTGKTANISAGTDISCSAGAVVATGVTVNISAGTDIPCTTGAVSIAGLSANISAGHTIACSTGSIAVTGLTATIGTGATIECSTGTVAVSGISANISAGTTIGCSARLVAVSGISANISAGTTISCSSGTIAATGLPAVISAGKYIPCTAGVVSVVGQSATISAGTDITCSTGTVEITGLPATISGAVTTITCTTDNISVSGLSCIINTTVTPSDRIYTIPAESRIYTIQAENRVYAVSAENRVYTIPAENRTYTIT